MAVYCKTESEIEILRQCNNLVSETLAQVAKFIAPGISTGTLNKIGEDYIREKNAIPSFLNYNGFPKSLCISINNEVVHGIPNDERMLQDGDIVSVDCGVFFRGFHGDSAYTFIIGNVASEVIQLLKVTKEALYKGIENAVVGKRVGDISAAVQMHAEHFGYGVVRQLVGHGVGRDLHEDPQVPNYGQRGKGSLMREGLVVAIEPMINMGVADVKQKDDGWTIHTVDGKVSAHFEHSVVVRKGKAEILSTFNYIEDVLTERGMLVI